MIKIFTNIYNSSQDISLIEKKVLAHNSYFKYLICQTDFNYGQTKSPLLMENSLEFKKTFFLPKSYFTKRDLIGYSVNLMSYKFRSKYSNCCSFNMPFYTNKKSNFSSFESIANKFITHVSLLILLTKAVKGGFKVYSNTGLFGFLPGSQYKKCIRHNRHYFRLLNLKFYLRKKNFNLRWISSNISKLKLRVFKSFFRRKGLKKKRYSNFIFVYKP
jgi:hypothetical protein